MANANLKFHLIQRDVRLGKLAGKKAFVAQPVLSGRITFERLCERMSKDTTVGKADVKAVLSQLADVIAEFNQLGFSVDCGELGTFRPSFGSKAVETEKEFTTALIRPAKIVFTPRVAFKESLKTLGFERADGVRGSEGVRPAPSSKPKVNGGSANTGSDSHAEESDHLGV